jgi:hypothetical protein
MFDVARQFARRLRSLFRAPQLDSELDAEMAAHLDLATEENMQRGMSLEEARRQALIRFGGAEQAKEQHRDARALPTFDELSQDLRYAIRTFRRDPVFVLIAVLIRQYHFAAPASVPRSAAARVYLRSRWPRRHVQHHLLSRRLR